MYTKTWKIYEILKLGIKGQSTAFVAKEKDNQGKWINQHQTAMNNYERLYGRMEKKEKKIQKNIKFSLASLIKGDQIQ